MNYEVGQRVWIKSLNRGAEGEATVVKVGRSLLHVQGKWGTPAAYRIKDGVRNDRYEHEWILTDAQMAALEREGAVGDRLKRHRIRLETGHSINLETQEQIADLLDASAVPVAPTPTPPTHRRTP
jgi:hypothetical protein